MKRRPLQIEIVHSEPSSELGEYRQGLVAAEQKSQEAFDKTVLSLSGGALGISFVFLKDVIGTNPVIHPNYLVAAWMSWAVSSFAVLFSFFLSQFALRRAIKQVDSRTIYSERPGGMFSIFTGILNALGGLAFVAGVVAITLFANANLSSREPPHDGQKTSASTTCQPATAPATPVSKQGSGP